MRNPSFLMKRLLLEPSGGPMEYLIPKKHTLYEKPLTVSTQPCSYFARTHMERLTGLFPSETVAKTAVRYVTFLCVMSAFRDLSLVDGYHEGIGVVPLILADVALASTTQHMEQTRSIRCMLIDKSSTYAR